MKGRAHSRLLAIVGIFILAITLSGLSSLAQLGLPIGVPVLPPAPPFLKVPHLACPDCFTYVCPDCYTIFEEVPGTGITIARQIPNPAPLELDAERLEFDPDTGLPIWYIGRQPYVGPTDEQPYSAEYPVPLIVLKRIHARQRGIIFNIPGVHGFGIGARGFVVFLDPQQLANKLLIPKELEGVPVEVEAAGPFESLCANAPYKFRPVPSGASIGVEVRGMKRGGTVGVHIVRTVNGKTNIHTLTAGHSVKLRDDPVSPTPVYQPSLFFGAASLWGTVIHGFQQIPCDTPADPFCQSSSAPLNLTTRNPDVAAIAHFNPALEPTHVDAFPHRVLRDPEDATGGDTYISRSPIRRLQYGGPSNYISGPSGIIVFPSFGTKAIMWGAESLWRPVGTIGPMAEETVLTNGASLYLKKINNLAVRAIFRCSKNPRK